MLCETLKVGELRKYPRFSHGRGAGHGRFQGCAPPARAAPGALTPSHQATPQRQVGRAFSGPGLQWVYSCMSALRRDVIKIYENGENGQAV